MNIPATTPAPRRRYRWVIAFFILLALAAGLRYSNGTGRVQEALRWVAASGFVGMVSFVAIYIVACICAIPGSLLTIASGTVFGLTKGVLLSSTGATLGATAAFLVGRYLARDWVVRRIEANPRFQAIDRAVAREGWKIVGLTRLSPVFPFVVLNYAYSVTGVSLRDFFFASWLGMLPATVLYVYLGSLVRDATSAGSGAGRSRTPLEWGLYAVGLVATLMVTVYVTRLARRALAERVA
jgi:uncharacterized membrane protein YdjX (TVP38/TMEM64 family)